MVSLLLFYSFILGYLYIECPMRDLPNIGIWNMLLSFYQLFDFLRYSSTFMFYKTDTSFFYDSVLFYLPHDCLKQR